MRNSARPACPIKKLDLDYMNNVQNFGKIYIWHANYTIQLGNLSENL